MTQDATTIEQARRHIEEARRDTGTSYSMSNMALAHPSDKPRLVIITQKGYGYPTVRREGPKE